MNVARALRSLTDLIVRCCDPDEIVLFGSIAKGEARPTSDIDLLIVGDFRSSRWLRDRELRALFRRYPLRIDAHLLTREELAAEAADPYGFVSTLRERGRVLYERKA